MLSNQLLQLAGAIGAAIAIATPAIAAPLAPIQMPNSTFDGAHSSPNWDPSSVDRVQILQVKVAKTCGIASFYGRGDGFAGKRTASGQIFDPYAMTTAHRTLPFGTRIKVTNQSNGKSVLVVGTDRGPYIAGRVLDLSYGAFAKIASPSQGVAQVCYTRA